MFKAPMSKFALETLLLNPLSFEHCALSIEPWALGLDYDYGAGSGGGSGASSVYPRVPSARMGPGPNPR